MMNTQQKALSSFVSSMLLFSSVGCRASEAQKISVPPSPAVSTVASPTAQGDHLVARWDFEDGSATNINDASGKGNGGNLVGDATRGNGIVGKQSLKLSGKPGSFMDVQKPVVDTTRSFTVAACVKLNRTNGFQTFVSIDGEQVSGFFLQLRDDSGAFAMTMLDKDSGNNATAIAAANDVPEPDHWYHVAGVYDATAHTVSLYVDGVLQQTTPCPASWKANGPTAIGRGKYGGGPVDFVDGEIDDVRLYDDALSATAIQAIAKEDVPANNQPPKPIEPASLQINAAGPSVSVSPMLYGLMTEEINYSYEGGLYGELVRNRVFKDNAEQPVHWSPVANAKIALDKGQPIAGTALTTALKVDFAASGNRSGVSNDGFWGMPARPNTQYRASFYAKAAPGFSGPLTVALESADGATVHATATVSKITSSWKKYTVTLKTGNLTPSKENRLSVSSKSAGTVWLNQVSLFPPTYKGRENGNRIDLMEKMASMNHAFLRLPGGNYLEGNTIAERFDWKATLGDISQRPGHPCPWGYRSSDGMGLLEFLQWCEEIKVEPVLGVFAGYALNGEHVVAGPQLEPFVKEALEEIEYLTGDTNTKWGAVRAKNGHPKPFPLTYVEIGNEDWFDKSGSYDGRFAQFYDAIKAKYPKLQLIATADVKSRKPDVIDEHYYRAPRAFERDVNHYDKYNRNGPKIFVGEWASQDGKPTPNLNSAIGDAVWLTGIERNSDIVVMEAYAPLLVNVNPGGSQWGTNLIGYDALNSFGSPSYYVQQMFGQHHGDKTVAATLAGGSRLYQSVTRNSKTGAIYVKLVNATKTKQTMHIALEGFGSISPNGKAVVLSSNAPSDTNSLQDPTKLVPVTSAINGVGKSFDYSLAPYSVIVLKLQAK